MTKKQSQAPSFTDAVVVGVDGHDRTHAALLWAAAEAARRKTRLVVMTAQDALTYDLPLGAGVDEVTATRRLVAMLARKGYGSALAFAVVRDELAAAGRDPVEDPG